MEAHLKRIKEQKPSFKLHSPERQGMRTRAEARQQVNYAKFEKTVNLLLMIAIKRLDCEPTIAVDGDTNAYKGLGSADDYVPPSSKVELKMRNGGTISRPDAEVLLLKDLLVVADAKYYNSELSLGTIIKTLDDMALRDTPYGLLVCSENTKSSAYDQLVMGQIPALSQSSRYSTQISTQVEESEFVIGNQILNLEDLELRQLKLIKLRTSEKSDLEFLAKSVNSRSFMPEYLNKLNVDMVQKVFQEFLISRQPSEEEPILQLREPSPEQSFRESTTSNSALCKQFSRESALKQTFQSQRQPTQFEAEIEKYVQEVRRDGLAAVAAKYQIKLTKSGMVDKRTRIGRVLFHRLQDIKDQPSKVQEQISAKPIDEQQKTQANTKEPEERKFSNNDILKGTFAVNRCKEQLSQLVEQKLTDNKGPNAKKTLKKIYDTRKSKQRSSSLENKAGLSHVLASGALIETDSEDSDYEPQAYAGSEQSSSDSWKTVEDDPLQESEAETKQSGSQGTASNEKSEKSTKEKEDKARQDKPKTPALKGIQKSTKGSSGTDDRSSGSSGEVDCKAK